MWTTTRRARWIAPAAALLLATISLAGAQEPARRGPPKPEAQIGAMKQLDYLAGTWTGTGSMRFGERESAFRGSEVITRKLDGTALLVEGAFFAKPPGAEQEIPVHTTLGVISYDAASGTYRFASWLASGVSGERELVVGENGWHWETSGPQGTVRYTMTLGESGEWTEIGERTKDGKTWEPFFEMTLRKE